MYFSLDFLSVSSKHLYIVATTYSGRLATITQLCLPKGLVIQKHALTSVSHLFVNGWMNYEWTARLAAFYSFELAENEYIWSAIAATTSSKRTSLVLSLTLTCCTQAASFRWGQHSIRSPRRRHAQVCAQRQLQLQQQRQHLRRWENSRDRSFHQRLSDEDNVRRVPPTFSVWTKFSSLMRKQRSV